MFDVPLPKTTDPRKLAVLAHLNSLGVKRESCVSEWLLVLGEVALWPEADLPALRARLPEIVVKSWNWTSIPQLARAAPSPTPGPLTDPAPLALARKKFEAAKAGKPEKPVVAEHLQLAIKQLYRDGRQILRDAYGGPKAPREARDLWNATRLDYIYATKGFNACGVLLECSGPKVAPAATPQASPAPPPQATPRTEQQPAATPAPVPAAAPKATPNPSPAPAATLKTTPAPVATPKAAPQATPAATSPPPVPVASPKPSAKPSGPAADQLHAILGGG
jgi:hypothetical protein